MGQIKTFEDGTKMGTFSQINFEDGTKVLLSFTQTEAALFKVKLLGFPGKKLWSMRMSNLMVAIAGKSEGGTLLENVVNLIVDCTTVEDAVDILNKISE